METDAARTTCSFCPKLCRHVCPVAVAEKTETATPTFKQQVARLVTAGALPLDRDAANVLYKCTGCLASQAMCRHEVDVETSLRDARQKAVAAGVAPPGVEKVRARFRAHGTPFDLDLRALTGAKPGARPEVAFVPSCTTAARDPALVERTRAALDAGRPGAASTVLADPACCGYPLDALGLQADFVAHARRVAASLEGQKRIVAGGAACAWTLAVRYKEIGVPLKAEVVPLAQELGRRADALRAARKTEPPGGPFAYHDACYLSRHLGVYDEPRAALAAATGAAPRELDPCRKDGLCSGGGGGYPLTHPGPSLEVARRLLESFHRTGARTLVTTCPTTKRQINKTDPKVPVLLLEEVVAAALTPSPAGPATRSDRPASS